MPEWFAEYLLTLNAREKAELGMWFLQPEHNNEDCVEDILEKIGA